MFTSYDFEFLTRIATRCVKWNLQRFLKMGGLFLKM